MSGSIYHFLLEKFGQLTGSRAYSVHADAVGYLLVVETAGEGYDGAFGGGVVEEVGAADVGID